MKASFDPQAWPARDSYKLLSGLVVPRPIGWIGTRSSAGRRNLAPFSFFNAVSGYPPTVLFSPGRFEGRPKDSWTNAVDTGEFTVNIVSHRLMAAMNATAAKVAPDEDEFALTGMTPIEGETVAAPMVGECAANLECRVSEVVTTGRAPHDAVVIFGEVVRFHADPELLDGTRVDQRLLDAVGRLGGPSYSTTRDRFDLERPD